MGEISLISEYDVHELVESESDNDDDVNVSLQNNPQCEMGNEVHTGCNDSSHEYPITD